MRNCMSPVMLTRCRASIVMNPKPWCCGTRPGFINAIQALAEGDAAVPHLPSIQQWRAGSRKEPYDPNKDGTRNEMRSYVCGQCHVEYYCANKMPLVFPWGQGMTADDTEAFWNDTRFEDGSRFYDF